MHFVQVYSLKVEMLGHNCMVYTRIDIWQIVRNLFNPTIIHTFSKIDVKLTIYKYGLHLKYKYHLL